LRRLWIRLGRGALALLALGLVAELGLRIFGYGDYIVYSPHEELLWEPVPNQRGRTIVGHEPITINAQGLRYPEDLPPKVAGEIRLFSFGDSVTMGWGVDDASHYTAVLETLLDAGATEARYRCVSAGVNAYPTALCVRRFAQLLEQGVEIDVAVLAYSFNQAFGDLAELEGDGRRTLLRRVRLKSVVRRSATYNFLIEDLLRTAVYYRLRDRLMAGSWRVEGQEDARAETPSSAVDTYTVWLERMRDTAEERDVRLIFLLLGSKGQRTTQLDEHQTAFRAFALQQGLPLVDMVGRLEGLDPEATFMDHTHPSAAGHALIAEELARVVRALP
jgi:lysophospholipase L1-like esterase